MVEPLARLVGFDKDVDLGVLGRLAPRQKRLPFHLDVIGFAEEEGVRFRSTFLGSSAVAGSFDMALLDRTDADGVTTDMVIGKLLEAMPAHRDVPVKARLA